jgi:beta-glucosidase/6-phospho-beta-glucosidase/beta-galactosidase
VTGPRPAGEHDFRWLTGFECSTFPQIGMDELALTQHDRFWGSDIVRALDAGCRTVRYGIRWHVVNPAPQVWDWASVDGPLELMRHLGMEPIVDLFHFGVPAWTGTGVLSSIFPDLQAELCAAFARRYPWVRWYTPTNEPYIMSQFGGETGAWYPYEHGPRNFVRALGNVARGLCEGWAAIREVRPDARMMISDTCEYWHALDEQAQRRADLMNERRFLMHELYGGRVGEDHPLRGWLVEHGMPEIDLHWFRENGAELDVIGLDHYPHSEHELSTGSRGELVDVPRALERQLGPAELCRQYFDRLGRPLMFAETGAPGDDAAKIAWLDRLVAEVATARAEGVPVIGITWWGLIDQVDWGTGLRRFRYDVDPTGLYSLEWRDERYRPAVAPDPPHADARGFRLERVPTAALAAWQRYAAESPEATVGRLTSSSTNAGIALW